MTGREPFDPGGLNDDELESLLGRALNAGDPVPDLVRAGALGAASWRTIDTDLAELAYDSADSALAAAGARSHATARQLTFRAGDVEIEVLVTDGGDLRIEGQLVAASAAEVELHGVGDTNVAAEVELHGIGDTNVAAVDALGRFRFADVPDGPVRFALVIAGRRVHSAWVVLRANP